MSNADRRERFITTSYPVVSIDHNPELPWITLVAEKDGQRIEVKMPRVDPRPTP